MRFVALLILLAAFVAPAYASPLSPSGGGRTSGGLSDPTEVRHQEPAAPAATPTTSAVPDVRQEDQNTPADVRQEDHNSPADVRQEDRNSPTTPRQEDRNSPANPRQEDRGSPASPRQGEHGNPTDVRQEDRGKPADARQEDRSSPTDARQDDLMQGAGPAGPTMARVSDGGLARFKLADGQAAEVVVDASVSSGLPGDLRLVVVFDPAPTTPNEVADGNLGGGDVRHLERPIGLQFALQDTATEREMPFPASLDSRTVGLRLPILGKSEPRDGQFAWLLEVKDKSGQFFGYMRLPAEFEPATNSLHYQVPMGELRGTLLLPALIVPAYVKNHDPAVHIWSSPMGDAVDFGVAAPQWTLFKVVGPQVGGRLFVYNPATSNYGWIDARGVGNVSASEATMPPPVAVEPALAETEPTLGALEAIAEEPRAESAGPPDTESALTPASAPPTHTVQPRDELRHIADTYGVSIRGIMAINDIPDPDNLRIGQVLAIPDPGQ